MITLSIKHFVSLCSRRGGGIFCLLGTIPSAKAGGHLRERRSLKCFGNRRERLSGVDLRVGNPVLLVGHHKPSAVQSHVVQIQDCFQGEIFLQQIGIISRTRKTINNMI